MITDAFDGKISDYEKAMSEFGIQDITKVVDTLEKDLLHPYMRRGLMFGHTDIEKIFEAIRKKQEFAVMTGIKPTGQYHIGSLITCKEVLYFQNLGGKVYFCIADMEAYLHSGVPLKAVNEFFPNKVKWFRDLTQHKYDDSPTSCNKKICYTLAELDIKLAPSKEWIPYPCKDFHTMFLITTYLEKQI